MTTRPAAGTGAARSVQPIARATCTVGISDDVGDAGIKEDLSERLSDDDVVDASDITIDVKNGVVTLSGTVAARHLKHRVEDIADHCGGVKDVENRLTVKSTASAVGGKEDAGNTH